MLVTVELENGETLKFETTSEYYTVTVDKTTWYWRRDTGEFEGAGTKVLDCLRPPHKSRYQRQQRA